MSEDETPQRLVLAADRAADSEQRLKLAVAAAGISVWELDLASQRIDHAPDLNRLYGFAPGEKLRLADFQARFAPGERERIDREVAAVAARGGRLIQTEFRIAPPDGPDKWLLMRAQLLPGCG